MGLTFPLPCRLLIMAQMTSSTICWGNSIHFRLVNLRIYCEVKDYHIRESSVNFLLSDVSGIWIHCTNDHNQMISGEIAVWLLDYSRNWHQLAYWLIPWPGVVQSLSGTKSLQKWRLVDIYLYVSGNLILPGVSELSTEHHSLSDSCPNQHQHQH